MTRGASSLLGDLVQCRTLELITVQQRSLQCGNPILNTRISSVCPFVHSLSRSGDPALDSKTGCTGELWLNCVLLILKTIIISLFSYQNKKIKKKKFKKSFFFSGLGWTGELWSNCRFLIWRHEDFFRPSVCSFFVTLMGPPLDSETGGLQSSGQIASCYSCRVMLRGPPLDSETWSDRITSCYSCCVTLRGPLLDSEQGGLDSSGWMASCYSCCVTLRGPPLDFFLFLGFLS